MSFMNPISPALMRRTPDGTFNETQIKQAFQDLEQVFLSTLLKEMRKTVPDGGLFESNHAGRMYEEMLDEAMSMAMAESGQLGIADAIEAQYRQREAADEVSAAGDDFLAMRDLAFKKFKETAETSSGVVSESSRFMALK